MSISITPNMEYDMIDKRETMKYNAEMAEHALGAAQFMDSLVGGRYVTKEQAREAMDFLLASTKRNIESYPYATRQEKDEEIRRKEVLMNMLKKQMGI
ncbi:MAG: hypothetical protein II612_02970 [Prevotella sp.]|nr:hypothetical protein [Prevotella sp.]